ncbi:MAG: hypothetical protein ACK56F_09080, partial [bacterium]
MLRNRAEEWIPSAYVAWQASTTNRVVVPARQAGNRSLGSLKDLKIRAQACCYSWRHSLNCCPVLGCRPLQARKPPRPTIIEFFPSRVPRVCSACYEGPFKIWIFYAYAQ